MRMNSKSKLLDGIRFSRRGRTCQTVISVVLHFLIFNFASHLSPCLTVVEGISMEESGPRFLEEWPQVYTFSNLNGGKVGCKADGKPRPKVQWLTKDFFPLSNLTSVREVYQGEDGSLLFKSFEWQNFRPDIHAISYRCRATNQVGTIISTEIHARPVLDVPFQIENNDVMALRGNIAVLRCSVPEDLKDSVSITSWVQDATINIYPSFQTGKYLLLPNGDLYVFNVDASDGYKTFACRTSFKMTNQAKTSQNSRIIVRDPESMEGIQLGVQKELTIKASAGEDVYLPCAAQGNPPPVYSWFRERDGILSDLLVKGRSKRPSAGAGNVGYTSQATGPILLTQVRPEDSGLYICRLNNSVSQIDVRISLDVYVPLSVQLSPSSQIVDVGRSANFRCLVSGGPVESISWFKDGNPIQNESASSSRFKISPRESLVVTSVQAEDAGMYQCFASNDLYSAQDSAQLRLGSILPELTYRFGEQTLQAGPSVSLKCTAVGNPPPQFHWTLDGFAIPENERFLVGQYVTIHDTVISHVNITNAQAEDGGRYTCQASNSMGSVTHSARLNIYGPPSIRLIPPIKAIAGKNLQISCPVSGYPIEAITWERGGSFLPVSRQQRVYPNGTLIIENIQRGSDEGIYTCHAKNRHGLTSNRDLHIQVVVPPKIMPFQFLSEYLQEGRRLAVSCQILEGDKPIEFTWLYQSMPISSSSAAGITVRIPDEYSSTLVIDSLTSVHNGEYTCMAENSAGKEQHTALLTVNVPPKWTFEPREKNASAGQLITLQCQADGHPTPSITWKRASSSHPGEYKELTGKTNVYQNGTIRFEQIHKSDEGYYLCEAGNGVGAGLSKVIYVNVNAPAEFMDRDEEISVKAGDKAILQCKARGDLPIEIQWAHKHIKITSHSSSRYTIRHQNLEAGVLSELLISESSRSDGGVYNCRAANSFGSDQTLVMLKVQEPPEQPGNLRLIEEQSRSIQISWSESFNGNSLLINFIIQYKFPSETWTEAEVEELAVPATQTTAIIPGLSPSTTYHLRVLAQNGMGFSRPSEIIQVTTSEEAPEGPPLDVHVEPLTSSKLRVSWSPPEKHLWHGNILGYYLGYREIGGALMTPPTGLAAGGFLQDNVPFFTSSSSPTGSSSHEIHGYHFKTVEVGMNFGGESTLDNLKKYTRYAVVVQTFNSKGTGPLSTPVIGTTEQDVPSLPPEKVSCTATSSESLQITWDDPGLEGRHGIIQGYKVMHQVSDSVSDSNGLTLANSQESEEFPVETKLTTSKTTGLHGLRPWTNYSVSVLAFTAMGDGKLSGPILCQTEEDVPTAPAGLKAVVSSRRSVLLCWLAPETPNGRINKFTLYVRFMEGTKIEKRILEGEDYYYEAIGLKEGQAYELWLTASTRMGEGDSTPRVQISPANKVPAKIASFSQTLNVPWKQDVVLRCDSAGIPQPTIVWKFNGKDYVDSTFTNSEQAKVGSGIEALKLSQLTPDQAGNYTCSVTNALGTDSIFYMVKIQVPPQAPALHVAQVYYDSLRLSWTLEDDGGSRVKGFVINYKQEAGDWEEYKLGSRANNHILGGLICGSKYQLFITAFNKIGTGKPSEILQARTKGTIVMAPKKEEVISGNSSSIFIKLESWKDLNCPVYRYTIEYKIHEERVWRLVAGDLSGDTKFYGIYNLQPNTNYDIQIAAINHAGRSAMNYSFLTSAGHLGGIFGVPESTIQDNESSQHEMNTSLLIVFPSILSLVAICGVIGVLCYFRRKRMGGGPKTVIGNSPGGLQILMESQHQGRSEHFCVVKSVDPTVTHQDPVRYKTIESTSDYGDDICPYATFQLPDKTPQRPMLNKGFGQGVGMGTALSGKKFGRHTGDTMYNVGNIYSGPYHLVQSPGFIYNQATLPVRDLDYGGKVGKLGKDLLESTESDNVGSTDSEVKKILTLHLPISEYDTLGSDSEGEKRQENSSPIHQPPQRILQSSNTVPIQHEMVTFRQRQRSDPVITSDHSSTSSDSSPSNNGNRKKSYFSRKSKSKSSVQSGSSSMKQRVRSSSGYSSHTEETSFRIQPPSRFSDSRDLSDGDEHEMGLMVGELTATTTIPSSSLITATSQDSRLPINFGSMKRAHNKSRHPPPVLPSSIHPQQQQQQQQQQQLQHQQRKGQTYHIDV